LASQAVGFTKRPIYPARPSATMGVSDQVVIGNALRLLRWRK
jgi:hypothetical protein